MPMRQLAQIRLGAYHRPRPTVAEQIPDSDVNAHTVGLSTTDL